MDEIERIARMDQAEVDGLAELARRRHQIENPSKLDQIEYAVEQLVDAACVGLYKAVRWIRTGR